MRQTEYNEYKMDVGIREVQVINKAEHLIDEGVEPRKAYEQVIIEKQEGGK